MALFEEAQRAWNRKQTEKFMRAKKGRASFEMSEPEFLISCMDRHQDWAVIVCLVGGGQEINTGEAGIGEWIDSLTRSFPEWRIFISSQLGDSEYGAGEPLEQLRARQDVVAGLPTEPQGSTEGLQSVALDGSGEERARETCGREGGGGSVGRPATTDVGEFLRNSRRTVSEAGGVREDARRGGAECGLGGGSAGDAQGQRVSEKPAHVTFDDNLHLSVSMRSFRSENVSLLVKKLLESSVPDDWYSGLSEGRRCRDDCVRVCEATDQGDLRDELEMCKVDVHFNFMQLWSH